MAMKEAAEILMWAEWHVPATSAAFIPGVLNWEADFLSSQTLDQEIFSQIVAKWGVPDIDVLASRHNFKVQCYCARTRDLGAVFTNTLVISWNFHKVYAFPPLAILPGSIVKIKQERTTTILIVPD